MLRTSTSPSIRGFWGKRGRARIISFKWLQ